MIHYIDARDTERVGRREAKLLLKVNAKEERAKRLGGAKSQFLRRLQRQSPRINTLTHPRKHKMAATFKAALSGAKVQVALPQRRAGRTAGPSVVAMASNKKVRSGCG